MVVNGSEVQSASENYVVFVRSNYLQHHMSSCMRLISVRCEYSDHGPPSSASSFALLVSHLQTLTDVRIEQKSYLVVGEAVAHGGHPFS